MMTFHVYLLLSNSFDVKMSTEKITVSVVRIFMMKKKLEHVLQLINIMQSRSRTDAQRYLRR